MNQCLLFEARTLEELLFTTQILIFKCPEVIAAWKEVPFENLGGSP